MVVYYTAAFTVRLHKAASAEFGPGHQVTSPGDQARAKDAELYEINYISLEAFTPLTTEN